MNYKEMISVEEAIECILEAIHAANYDSSGQISLALDVAASEFYNNDNKPIIWNQKISI